MIRECCCREGRKTPPSWAPWLHMSHFEDVMEKHSFIQTKVIMNVSYDFHLEFVIFGILGICECV